MSEPTPSPADRAFLKTAATNHNALLIAVEVARELKTWTVEQLGRQQSKMVAELMALRARVKDLEARALTDGGVWSDAKHYRSGAVTTHSGTMWVAQQETNERPGTSSAWRMMAKSHK